MHVRCDDEPAENPIQRHGYVDVGVIEHRGQVQRGFADEHGQRARAQQNGGAHLDAHGDDHADGMEPQAGGDIDVVVGVVDLVKAPEERHDVEDSVLQIHDQI